MALKIYTQVTYGLNKLYFEIYMYVYVFVYKHELMISLKEDHLMTLKESRWICVSVWREKRKVTDILIIYISKFSEEEILLQLQHMFAN